MSNSKGIAEEIRDPDEIYHLLMYQNPIPLGTVSIEYRKLYNLFQQLREELEQAVGLAQQERAGRYALEEMRLDLKIQLEQVKKERDAAPKLWDCPDCGFAFDTIHTDEPGGGHSCPLCELAAKDKVLTHIGENMGDTYLSPLMARSILSQYAKESENDGSNRTDS